MRYAQGDESRADTKINAEADSQRGAHDQVAPKIELEIDKQTKRRWRQNVGRHMWRYLQVSLISNCCPLCISTLWLVYSSTKHSGQRVCNGDTGAPSSGPSPRNTS